MSAPAKEPVRSLSGDSSDENFQGVHAELMHTKPEPKEGYAVLPLFLLALLSTLVFVCCIYFIHFRGGFDPLVHDERFDPHNATGVTAKADPVAAGKRLFNMPGACVTCHQATGLGLPPTFPPLVKSEWVLGSEDRLIRILLHGMTGEIKVLGTSFTGAMPAFGATGFNWSDERIANVLTYIRQEWGNTAGPVSAEKVTEIRTKAAAGRTAPWTAAEIEAVP